MMTNLRSHRGRDDDECRCVEFINQRATEDKRREFEVGVRCDVMKMT